MRFTHRRRQSHDRKIENVHKINDSWILYVSFIGLVSISGDRLKDYLKDDSGTGSKSHFFFSKKNVTFVRSTVLEVFCSDFEKSKSIHNLRFSTFSTCIWIHCSISLYRIVFAESLKSRSLIDMRRWSFGNYTVILSIKNGCR